MSQIKYILSACLILLMIVMGIFLFRAFPESGIAKNQNLIDISQQDVVSQQKEFSTTEVEGKSLFEKNCNTCHATGKTDNFLEGFENRSPWKNRRELYRWIRDPKNYILHDATGYTAGLKEKFVVSMLPSPNLSDGDIDKVIDYLIKTNKQ